MLRIWQGRTTIWQRLEKDMSGNYEFVRQVARDKQSAFINDARQYRLAKKAGNKSGRPGVATYLARAGTQLQSAAAWVAGRASSYAAD
jgi:hypothetical protein